MVAGRKRVVEYNLADRPVQSTLRDAVTGEELYQTALLYDKYNNVSKFKERAYGTSYQTAYSYDTENRPTNVKYMDDANKAVSYVYDGVGRIATRTVKNGASSTATSTYTYVPGRPGVTGSTTPLVAGIAQPGMSFAYEYDSRGNITKETRTPQDGTAVEITYDYDSMRQLTRVNDPTDTTAGVDGTTWVYAYDLGGNIQSKTRYAYTTDEPDTAQQTIAYGYGDVNWKDLLTSYDGKEIEYTPPDKVNDPNYFHMGNPYQYDGWTYEWQAGRQLKSMTHRDEQGVQDKKLEFAYDAAGLRIQKKYTYTDSEDGVVVETTDYTLHGKLLTHQKTTTTVNGVQQGEPYQLHFYYDKDSRPMMVRVGNEEEQSRYYSYVHSLQDDVLGLIDKAQELAVQYSYSPWGEDQGGHSLKTECDKLVELNPFRYRGYQYDIETGLFYIGARYYNPEIARWISSEPNVDTGEFDKGAGLLAYNVYAYCANNPIKFCDPTGEFIFAAILISAAIGFVAGAVSSAITQQATTGTIDWDHVATSGLAGAVGGAIGGGVGGALYGMAAGSSVSIAQAVVIGGTSSVAAGIGARTVYNAAYNSDASASNQLNYVFSSRAMLTDYALGGITGGAFHIASNLTIVNVGRINGLQKSGRPIAGYPGIRYQYKGGAIKSIEIHPNHNGHGIHLQKNVWWYSYRRYPGQPALGHTPWRFPDLNK